MNLSLIANYTRHLKGIAVVAGFVVLMSVLGFASASNVYIAQSAAGAGNGSDCTDALAVTFFNTPANWGSGSTQIGPGSTAHLCGTITTPLTVQGSGSAGNVITVLFEAGAKLSAPAAPAGVPWLNLNHQAFIVVDGGPNGVIENTANGTGLANSVNSGGVGDAACAHDLEIKNLTVQNIFVRTSNSSDTTSGANSAGIALLNCGSNISVHNNTSTQAHVNIYLTTQGNSSNWNIYDNTTVSATWGIAVAVSRGTDTLANVKLYGNDVSEGASWEDPADVFHKDGIFMFGQGGGGGGGSITTTQIYNNYVHGNWGAHATAYLFLCQNVDHFDIFNNLFVSVGGGSSNGLLTIGYGADHFRVLNNTFVGNGPSNGGIAFGETGGATSITFQNNIVENFQNAIYALHTTFTTIDNNIYFNVAGAGTAGAFCDMAGCVNTFASWKSRHDTNGAYGDPKLDASYKPQSGSAAIGIGANLSSLNVPALLSDKAGTPRPSTGMWDVAAYNSGQPTPPLTPPTNLAAMVQ